MKRRMTWDPEVVHGDIDTVGDVTGESRAVIVIETVPRMSSSVYCGSENQYEMTSPRYENGIQKEPSREEIVVER